jgi:hypothetical protein
LAAGGGWDHRRREGAIGRCSAAMRLSTWVQGREGDNFKKMISSPCGNLFCYIRNNWSKVQVVDLYRLSNNRNSSMDKIGKGARP